MFQRILSFIRKFSRTLEVLNLITIDSTKLLNNLLLHQKKYRFIFPVVKSNAYGHGIKQVAHILNRVEVPYIAVESYYEYLSIAHITKHDVLIMEHNLSTNLKYFNWKRIALMINNLETLKIIANLNKSIRVHLKFNTGMNRQGIEPSEVSEVISTIRTSKLVIEGIATHLADADGDNPSPTYTQVEIFKNIVDNFSKNNIAPIYIHAANSAGVAYHSIPFANTARVGLGMYGYFTGSENEFTKQLQPVLTMTSTIINTRIIKPGDKIGYNFTYTAEKPMKIGVISAGYYEGVNRALQNHDVCTYGSSILPFVGRVSMNMAMINITNTDLKLEDKVTVISDDKNAPNSVYAISRNIGTIPYVVITKLSESIRRVIL